MATRFAALMCDKNGFYDSNEAELFYGILHGFPVVDESSEIVPYECTNYSSILSPEAKSKMDAIIQGELEEGMIAIVDMPTLPTC